MLVARWEEEVCPPASEGSAASTGAKRRLTSAVSPLLERRLLARASSSQSLRRLGVREQLVGVEDHTTLEYQLDRQSTPDIHQRVLLEDHDVS